MLDGLKQVTEQERVITRMFKILSCEPSRPWQENPGRFWKILQKVQANTYQTEYSTGLSQATSEQKAFSLLGWSIRTKPLWTDMAEPVVD